MEKWDSCNSRKLSDSLEDGIGLQEFLAIRSRHLDGWLLEMGIKCFHSVFTTM